jgi:hypothetical protein
LSLLAKMAVDFRDSPAAAASSVCHIVDLADSRNSAGAQALELTVEPKPRSYLCACRLKGRSPRRVKSTRAVNSAGWWPRAISSMVEGPERPTE